MVSVRVKVQFMVRVQIRFWDDLVGHRVPVHDVIPGVRVRVTITVTVKIRVSFRVMFRVGVTVKVTVTFRVRVRDQIRVRMTRSATACQSTMQYPGLGSG